jgi:ribosome-binding protein aMBF1 (putative translation factor)
MGRSFSEIIARRDARLTPAGREQVKVFEQAYDLAAQVMELRDKHGLTQAELAKRCGVDQGDISRIERGETSPTTRTLQRIADALGADLRLVEREQSEVSQLADPAQPELGLGGGGGR